MADGRWLIQDVKLTNCTFEVLSVFNKATNIECLIFSSVWLHDWSVTMFKGNSLKVLRIDTCNATDEFLQQLTTQHELEEVEKHNKQVGRWKKFLWQKSNNWTQLVQMETF